jgi:hypothetical protein
MKPCQSVESASRLRVWIAGSVSVFSWLVACVLDARIWLLCDGLGPDAIESSGIDALQRFWSGCWPVALCCFALFGVAFVFCSIHAPCAKARTGRAETTNLVAP